MNAFRTFNRFELKYLLSLKQAAQFKTGLRAFLVPDEYGGRNGRYTISSLYYDSPNLRCYLEKEAGLKFRRKLRIRSYETGAVLSDASPVFVEIKQRLDRVTQKRRVRLSYRDALRLCSDRHIPEHDARDRSIIEEIAAFTWQYNLRPVSIVRYERQALVGTAYDPGLRVTFDSLLSFQAHPLHLHEPPSGLLMLPPQQVVMEIKVNERLPGWLAEMIAAHNLSTVRVSKYCRSIDAAEKLPGAGWRKPVPESAGDILATSLSVFTPLERKMEIGR